MPKFGKKIAFFNETQQGLYTLSSSFDVHYEELREIPTINLENNGPKFDDLNTLKFKSKLTYNFLVENYETYLNTSSSITEKQLPDFYNFVSNKILYNGKFITPEGVSFFNQPADIVSDSESPTTVYISSSYASTISGFKENLSLEKYLSKFNGYKSEFPFYTEIKFDTHEKTRYNISDVFFDKNLTTEFLSLVMTSTSNLTSNFNETQYSLQYKKIDSEFIDKMITFNNKDLSFILELDSRLSNKNFGYTEVVGYRLQKFAGGSRTLIKEWIVPNTSETAFTFIDSQIKYDLDYVYKLSYIVLTIAKIDENQELIVYLADSEDFCPVYSNKVLDFPPLEPEIEFIPYIRVQDKIGLLLNSSVGRKRVTPISISLDDDVEIEKFIAVQDSFDGKLSYKTDDYIREFEILKLDFFPTSYKDFLRGERFFVSTNRSSGAAFKDEINPNTKYYYIIRSRDFHNHVSNPSQIYEIEIINDGGTIYHNINMVDIKNRKNNVQPTRSFKKYLKIKPSLGHTIVDVVNNQIKLGILDEKVWDKKFKVRLISKSTGKKIDLNIVFSSNTVTIQSDTQALRISESSPPIIL